MPEAAWNRAVVGILGLMTQSAIHRDWSIASVERLVMPPLALGQVSLLAVGDDLVGFSSYAFLTQEAEAGFIAGTHKLQPDDWNAGDRIWLIDAIAPYGHGRALMSHVRGSLRESGHKGREIKFRRTYPGNGQRRYARAML